MLQYAMPSTYAGALIDAYKGNKSFVGSLIEGNEGLGNPYANFAFDILAPVGTIGGVLSKAAPKIGRFATSNLTGKWTQFGNNMKDAIRRQLFVNRKLGTYKPYKVGQNWEWDANGRIFGNRIGEGSEMDVFEHL